LRHFAIQSSPGKADPHCRVGPTVHLTHAHPPPCLHMFPLCLFQLARLVWTVCQPAVTVLTIHAHTLTFYETSRMDAYIPRASALSHLHCIMILPYGLQYWYDSTFLQKNAGVSCSRLYLEHIYAAPNFLCPRPLETARKLRLDFPIKPNHLQPSLAKALSLFCTSETTE
jgi:hypothetical protein